MRRLVMATVVVVTVLLAGCSGSDGPAGRFGAARATSVQTIAEAPPTIPTATTPPASPASTTAPPSTIAPATTTTTTTTIVRQSSLVLPETLPAPAPAPVGDGPVEPRVEVGSIEIPRIGLSRTMFEGVSLSTLDRGPGHWPGTALPGQTGNVVVAGHRVSHNEDFRDLDQLVPGDEVAFTTVDGRHLYRVVATEIVGPEALWIVDQTPAPTATLFACHPPGSTRQRIVVHLQLM